MKTILDQLDEQMNKPLTLVQLQEMVAKENLAPHIRYHVDLFQLEALIDVARAAEKVSCGRVGRSCFPMLSDACDNCKVKQALAKLNGGGE